MKKFDYKDNKLIIKFSVDSYDFPHVLAVVKSLENRQFDAINKVWIASATEKNITVLLDNDFQASLNVPRKDAPYVIAKTPQKEVDRSRLPKELYEYQIRGVEFLEALDGTGGIFDDQGIGKTAQAISYAKLHPELNSVLIVCPATLKINWQREIYKWTGENSYIISGTQGQPLLKNIYRYFIINYDILFHHIVTLISMNFQLLIGDEVQAISNPKAKRTKAFISLARIIPKRILLSGTPMRNNAGNFFTSLSIIAPKEFTNRWKFLNRYMQSVYNGFTWVFKGSQNEEELHARIAPYIIRRTKKEVLPQLPDKTRSIIPFEMNIHAVKEYNNAENSFVTWANENARKKLEGQKHFEILKQVAYAGKRNDVITWIADFLETGEKLVVYVYHKEAIKDLYQIFKNISVVVSGDTSMKDRQKAIDDFQNKKEIQLFIGQIIAAGSGITLTAASNMAIVEFTSVPADIVQAEDRILRIGQNANKVSIYYLVASGTIEEDIALMIESKYKTIGKILDGKELGGMFNNKDFLEELAERISQRRNT